MADFDHFLSQSLSKAKPSLQGVVLLGVDKNDEFE
jgi:hypothetical protein